MAVDKDRVRLRHMLDAAREAAGYAQGKTREDLGREPMLAHSLVHCLEILGEPASQISLSTREKLPEIPWRTLVAMRNRLIHAYHDIDLTRVWKTVVEDLPGLVEQLERHSG